MTNILIRWIQLSLYGYLINCKECFRYLKIIRHFYHNTSFAITDLKLHWHYLWNNPYHLCQKSRHYLPKALTQPYGETPLLDFSKLIHHLHLTEKDRFIELGCGRVHLVFWLAHFTPCAILAVDIVPEFIRYGNRLAQQRHLSQLHFDYSNMLAVDFSTASCVYLYGTSLKDEYIIQLVKKLSDLPNGAKVITVSYSLSEYGAENFIVEKRLLADFIWGQSYFYIQKKVSQL